MCLAHSKWSVMQESKRKNPTSWEELTDTGEQKGKVLDDGSPHSSTVWLMICQPDKIFFIYKPANRWYLQFTQSENGASNIDLIGLFRRLKGIEICKEHNTVSWS